MGKSRATILFSIAFIAAAIVFCLYTGLFFTSSSNLANWDPNIIHITIGMLSGLVFIASSLWGVASLNNTSVSKKQKHS
jgi:hypothetical protein